MTLYKNLFNTVEKPMIAIEADTGSIIGANLAAQRFYHYSEDQLRAMNIRQIQPAESEKNGDPVFTARHQLNGGDFETVQVTAATIDQDQKIIRVLAIDPVEADTELTASLSKSFAENQLNIIMELSSDLILLFDVDGVILNMNPAGEAFFNTTRANAIGKKLKDFFKDNDYARLRLLADEVIENKKALHYTREKLDRSYFVHLHPVLSEKDEVENICVIAKDVSDVKQTQKVFSAVQQAGGFCNEMNQPMQVIMGNLELMKIELKENEQATKIMDKISNHIDQLKEIHKKLTHITQTEVKEYAKGTIFDIDSDN